MGGVFGCVAGVYLCDFLEGLVRRRVVVVAGFGARFDGGYFEGREWVGWVEDLRVDGEGEEG